jgi:hypothetical protein
VGYSKQDFTQQFLLMARKGFIVLLEEGTTIEHHRPVNILGFFGGKKKHQVFSPAAADET